MPNSTSLLHKAPPSLAPREIWAAAQAERAKREKARRHLLDFGLYAWPGFEVRPHRALIASALEGALERRWTRLMIFMPPQYGKSTLVSQIFPAWWLGRLPHERIIQASYAASLATRFSRRARNLVASAPYGAVFNDPSRGRPPVALARDSRRADEWNLAPPYRGGMKAAGVGGGITGQTAHLGNIDDPLKGDVEARSETTREAQIGWFQGDFYTRLDPEAVVVVTMTRWHEQDLAGYLLGEQATGGELWHVLRLPALAETPEERADWCKRSHITPDRYLIARWDTAAPAGIRAVPAARAA